MLLYVGTIDLGKQSTTGVSVDFAGRQPARYP